MSIRKLAADLRESREKLDQARAFMPPELWDHADAHLRRIERTLAEQIALTARGVQRFEKPELWDLELE
jgi:hypothetical protein